MMQKERSSFVQAMRLEIEKLVYGGDGLARTDRGIVFVPGTAVGDIVEAEIVHAKKDYATAKLLRILEPSPDRQAPDCPNYATEGCCHWQHIQYPKQVDYKEAILRETLSRLGRLSWDGEIKRLTGPDRHYRIRATFHVFNGRLGFVHGPIPGCASLVPELNAFIPTVDAPAAREVQALSAPEVVAAYSLRDGTVQRTGRAVIHLNGFHYAVTADTFFQANRFLLAPFIKEVIEHAGPSPGNVLELYSGAGFFSIPLARQAQEVIAIESNRRSVRQARENAKLNKVDVRFVDADVRAALDDAQGLKADAVVLDPPRAGCGVETIKRVAESGARKIIYISCNPSTFAREAAALTRSGYGLRRLTLVDQFPNTYHIETVASFELK